MDRKIYKVSALTWTIPIGYSFMVALFIFSAIMAVRQLLFLQQLSIITLLLICILLAIFFVLSIALWCFTLPTIRLELSDDGIIFSSAGYRIYTPWENIVGIGWTRFSRSFPSSIQLKEPAVVGELSLEEGRLSRRAVTEKRSWWMGNWQLKADAQYTRYIRIPVLFFRRKEKQDGSVDQYLQYYLPHLMQYR